MLDQKSFIENLQDYPGLYQMLTMKDMLYKPDYRRIKCRDFVLFSILIILTIYMLLLRRPIGQENFLIDDITYKYVDSKYFNEVRNIDQIYAFLYSLKLEISVGDP